MPAKHRLASRTGWAACGWKFGVTSSLVLASVLAVLGLTFSLHRRASEPGINAVSAPFPMADGTSWGYGPGINADGLANTQVGGKDCGCDAPGSRTSYRFRAQRSTLAGIRIFLQDGAGYGSGNGGTIRVDLRTDDGTSNHFPSKTTIASLTIKPGNPLRDNFPVLNFAPVANLNSDQLYHLVFTNIDPNPSVNFQSVNALHVVSSSSPRQPKYSDVDWAQLLNTGHEWLVRPDYTPVLQLNYADGSVDGVGYMEVWPYRAKRISGQAAVRESFVLSGPDKTPASFWMRLRNTGHNGALNVRLEQEDGKVLEQGSIPSSAVPSSYGWVQYVFRNRPMLQTGRRYRVVLTSSGEAAFETFPIRHGTSYGFAPNSVFADGYAEFTLGSDWKVWSGPENTGLREADLQFYFVLQQPTASPQHSSESTRAGNGGPRVE